MEYLSIRMEKISWHREPKKRSWFSSFNRCPYMLVIRETGEAYNTETTEGWGDTKLCLEGVWRREMR